MSLDVYLTEIQPVEVYWRNITHNLGKMAAEVKLDNGLNLYQVLWRPEEHGLTVASQIVNLLDEGWKKLQMNPDKFKSLNPENGWGDYTGLCDFVFDYRKACLENPNSKIEISR